MTTLDPLRDGPKGRAPEVRNAYRYLRGAHRSVSGLFEATDTLSTTRRAANAVTTGRMAENEVDVVRAAIAFTSSGLDATMKRLVTDVGRHLISTGASGARAMYVQYMKEQLAQESVDLDLRAAVVDPDANEKLLTYYLAARTKASFQGSGDLKTRVRGVLGISKGRVPDKDLEALDSFFIARNRIAHSMDFTDAMNSAATGRNHRSVEEAVGLCNSAFTVAAELAHAAAEVVEATR